MDISRVLSPEPLLWADDEAEREQSDSSQRRRYYSLILSILVFSIITLFSRVGILTFRTELKVAFHAAVNQQTDPGKN